MKGKNNKLLGFGIAGTVVVALCCFTPFLVVTLGAVGLSAWLGWLDFVLFPLLIGFLGLSLYALARRAKRRSPAETTSGGDSDF